MEHQKIWNLLNEEYNTKLITRKWNVVNDNSKTNYDATNENTYNTDILKSNLCDYNDSYIFLSGDISIVDAPTTQVAFRNKHHSLNVSQKLMKQQ